jgi:hypothetical protein
MVGKYSTQILAPSKLAAFGALAGLFQSFSPIAQILGKSFAPMLLGMLSTLKTS